MALAQFPQHVLQNIISLLIHSYCLQQGLELRLVSKQFNREVEHAFFDRDEKLALRLHYDIQHNIPPSVRFRFLRGFILRRDFVGRQLQFWQQLDAAVSILAQYEPKQCHGPVVQETETMPDRFFSICTNSDNLAVERAIAMLVDAVFAFSNDTFDALELMSHQWYEIEGFWDVLRDKDADFWVMVVAARRKDVELGRSAIKRLNGHSSMSRQNIASNLADALRIPAQEGWQDMIDLILSQENVELLDVKRRIHVDMPTIIELAIQNGHMSIIETLVSLGWNLADLPLDYASALLACVGSDKNTIKSKRKEVLEYLLNLTNEWQSERITTGMIKELCYRGDEDCVKMVTGRYQKSTNDRSQYDWDWPTGLLGSTALDGAVKSHTMELVRYVLDNRETLSSILADCFTGEGYLQSLELAISEHQADILGELLKETLPVEIMREKLFAYAALRGDPKCLECLSHGVDLTAKLGGRLLDLDEHQEGSSLWRAMARVQSRTTALLATTGYLSFGAFSLILALKAYNIENVKYFLQTGIRIGRRYIEVTRNHQTRNGALLIDDDDYLPGKGTLFGITYKMHRPLSFRHMLNQGGLMLPKTLVVARWDGAKHERIRKEIEQTDNPGQPPKKQNILLRMWERCLFVSYTTSSWLRMNDASILLQIEVPVPVTRSEVYKDSGKLRETFTEMQDVLWKYRQPSIYFDYASLGSYGGFDGLDD